MTDLQREIEKKANELFEFINDPLLWTVADQDKKCKARFIRLARAVLISELEARRNETDRYLDVITSGNEYYIKRKQEIESKIKQIRGEM